VLFWDQHSEAAAKTARSGGTHLISSLAWAETNAVIARIEREQHLSAVLADSARDVLARGPWRRVHIEPGWERAERLARAWPLRGADLWHLTAAKELQDVLPELTFLSFDPRLSVAADGEGLRAPP
jgi:predicted nucleic acid-binding protein